MKIKIHTDFQYSERTGECRSTGLLYLTEVDRDRPQSSGNEGGPSLRERQFFDAGGPESERFGIDAAGQRARITAEDRPVA